MVHEPLILQVVFANFDQVIGKRLPFREQLLVAAVATVQRVTPGVDNFCVRQNQLQKSYVLEVIWVLVRKKRTVAAMPTGALDILAAKGFEPVCIKVRYGYRVAAGLVRVVLPGASLFPVALDYRAQIS